MKLLVLALSVALGLSPAHAEFTDAEKVNVHALILNINLIRSGLQDQVAIERFPGYYSAWQAAVDCHNALGYLFGTQIKQGEETRAAQAELSRTSVLSQAQASLGRCTDGLATAQAQTTATNKYGQARLAILAFPWTGSGGALYQSPKPASWPKVIGPHGDYDFAQENAWFAVKYAHDALYVWGSRYLCDVANYTGLVIGALANIRFTWAETGDGFDSTVVDTVDNVLWLQKFALEDTVTKYLAALMNELGPGTSNAGDRLATAVKIGDSWKNLDRAIRNTLCMDVRGGTSGAVPCDRSGH